MATINSILSQELQVPPLKPGEFVKFRLLKKGRIDPQTEQPLVFGDYWQHGKEVIYDPFKKERVLLLNSNGVRIVDMPDGLTRQEPRVESVMWDETGEKLLGEDQFETICFLRRSNKNGKNPFRDKKMGALFEEVNEQVSLNSRQFDEDLELEARLWVRDAPVDELKAMAENLGITYDPTNMGGIRMSVADTIKKDPRSAMIHSSNTKAKKKIQVMDALQYEIVIFDNIGRTFYYKDDLSKPLCEVPRDKDKVDGLLAFFATDEGKGHYANFANKVAKLYEATVA